MTRIRPARLSDLDQFYAISLATGHLGADASHLYDDPHMMGHIYSAPYLKLAPALCLVAEDEDGVCGFIVGALETTQFEDGLERAWWPALRTRYADPSGQARASWSTDQRRSFMIHHPQKTPEGIVRRFPSHLHLNLLARAQGKGIGPRLLDLWLEKIGLQGGVGVHVGTNAQNSRAVKFWKRCGFTAIDASGAVPAGRTVWLGRRV